MLLQSGDDTEPRICRTVDELHLTDSVINEIKMSKAANCYIACISSPPFTLSYNMFYVPGSMSTIDEGGEESPCFFMSCIHPSVRSRWRGSCGSAILNPIQV